MIATNVYYSGAPAEGLVSALAKLRELGAVATGAPSWPRVPMDVAIGEPALLGHARAIAVVGDTRAAWTATVTSGPYWWVSVQWRTPGLDLPTGVAAGIDVLGKLAALGPVDFAVCHTAPPAVRSLDDYRATVLCRCPSAEYAREGPAGLGTRTLIGQRMLGLMEPATRELLTASPWAVMAAGGTLAVGDETFAVTEDGRSEWRRLDTVFSQSGVALMFPPRAPWLPTTPGPRWRPLPPSPGPTPLSPAAFAVVQQLQSSNKGKVVTDVTAEAFVAPFAELRGIHAAQLELEGAILPFAELEASNIDDGGLVKADLRGVHARRARWTEVSLVGADLRWADFADTELPLTRADDADCSFIELTGSRSLESAASTRFDDARADRWTPGPNPNLAGATFRRASLRGARLDGADLHGAVFDGADLTGASFRRADLRGASFLGCAVDDVDLNEANIDGAVFDRSPTS